MKDKILRFLTLASGLCLLASARAGTTFQATNDTTRSLLVSFYATNASGQYIFGGGATISPSSNSSLSTNAVWSGMAIVNSGLQVARISAWANLANTNGANCSYLSTNGALVYYQLAPNGSVPGSIGGTNPPPATSATPIGQAAYYFGTNASPNGVVSAAVGSIYSQFDGNYNFIGQYVKGPPNYSTTNWVALTNAVGLAFLPLSPLQTTNVAAAVAAAMSSNAPLGGTLTINGNLTAGTITGYYLIGTVQGSLAGLDLGITNAAGKTIDQRATNAANGVLTTGLTVPGIALNRPVVTGGIFTGPTNVNSLSTNPTIVGGLFSGQTNIFILTNFTGGVALGWTNSPTIVAASRLISEGFLTSTRPVPIVAFNTWYQWAYNVNELDVMTDLANLANTPAANLGRNFYYFVFGVSPTNTASPPTLTGTLVDSKGIIQVDTNRFPHGLAWLGQQVHNAGFSFGYGLIMGPQDGYPNPAACNVGDNMFGNAMYAITNYGVDMLKGHGDWALTPAASFDQEVQAQLACVQSGRRVQFHPEDCWIDPSNSPTFLQYWPLYTKFFSAPEVLSGSGFPDQVSGVANIRAEMLYFATNFPSGVAPGHWWNQLSYLANGTTIGDATWRSGKIGASATAMFSAGYVDFADSTNMLYQSIYLPLDVINRVDKDPLMSFPKLVQTNATDSNEIWTKKLEGNGYAVWAVNWDTNSAATNQFSVGTFLPNNVNGYTVHDCWSSVQDRYVSITATITNVFQSGDCNLYVFKPVQTVDAAPLDSGLIFDMPLSEVVGSTSVASYLNSQPQLLGTVNGTAYLTPGQIANALYSTNASIAFPGAFSSMSNCITFPRIAGLDGASAFTLDTLFRQYGTTAYYPTLFDYGDFSAIPLCLYLNNVGNLIEVALATTTTNLAVAPSSAAASDGYWHQASLTYNGTNLVLYIDGASLASWAATGTLTTPTAPTAYIGALTGGAVGRTRIWNRALNATEIKLLYRQSFPN